MNILLAATGSISAYKSLDLARLWINDGHEVKVILSKGALEFVKPEVFKYLGCQDVFLPQDDFGFHNQINHIELGKWANTFIIAPLSANTLANIVQGQAHNILCSTFLAYPTNKPILFFPAMNINMYQHNFVQANLNRLNQLKNIFIHKPDTGLLACKDRGIGKLPHIDRIKHFTESFTLNNTSKKVLITTGATISPIDPVRYLTNASSGLTGLHLAKECLRIGYKVVVIAGKNAIHELDFLSEHPNFQLHRVVTTSDMEKLVDQEFSSSDLYISSAAIGDIEFDSSIEKLKKSSLSNKLSFKQSTDILAKVLSKKTSKQKVVGFAAETNLDINTLQEKWKRKPVDLLIGTKVNSGLDGASQQGFSNEQADYIFFQNGKIIKETNLLKTLLPHEILKHVSFLQ